MPTQPRAPDEIVTLSDGTTAHLREHDGSWTLQVDGVRQSHVGPATSAPAMAYARWMLAALAGRGPIDCAHLGGGLLTVPRAIAVRHPGSRQHVVELEPVLVELARTRFGLPDGVTLEVGDARAWLDAATTSRLDAVLVDVFAGGRIPPAFTSREFLTAARGALAEDGLLVINSVAGPDLLFTRRELATLRAVFEHAAMIVQGSALQGARFGNATLIGSAAPLDVEAIRAALAGDPSRGALVTDLDPIIDGAEPVHDVDELWSPTPTVPDLDGALRMLEGLRHTAQAARDAMRP